MNILPKKSWHVRNKDNVERVRRDEENARLEEEERARRAAVAEQEARTALLRARSRGIKPSESTHNASESGAVVSASSKTQHINFFEDIERGLRHGNNPEYEAEKKAEQEKYERGIGLLTYVGQSSAEAQADKPWYFQPQHKQEGKEKNKKEHDSNKEVNKKNSLDPLKTMKKYLEMKEERSEHQHKNHSREKDRKHKHKSNDKDSRHGKKKKSLQELREERMRREREEHDREQRVLARARGEVKKPSEHNEQTDRHRYNSQFNPDLVRKPRGHHRYNPY